MNDSSSAVPPFLAPRRLPRARMYTRLLLIIPGLALLAVGLWKYLGTEDDGTVNAIRLTTKAGLVGEAAEAVQLVKLSSPDLYLKLNAPKAKLKTDIYSHTPLGNGLTWKLTKAMSVRDVREVEVWDHHTVLSDKMQDRVSLNSGEHDAPAVWGADGQTFHIELQGTRNVPPTWAMPLIVCGGAISGLVLLRFVWDQAI